MYHLNLNEVLETKKFYYLELDIQSLLCIQCRTVSGTTLKDREAFADYTEVTHTIRHQTCTSVITSGGPWTSVGCKEVSSQKTRVFSILSFPKPGPKMLQRPMKNKCPSDDTCSWTDECLGDQYQELCDKRQSLQFVCVM